MVWKHNGRTIQIGKAWVSDNNYKYPRQWNNLTDAQKKSAGLVWEDDPVVETFDNRFYSAKDVELKLADENAVDDSGKAIIDIRTGKQMVALGLKSIWINKTKEMSKGLLSPTDWYVTRKAEADTAIPNDISKFSFDNINIRAASSDIYQKMMKKL